MGLHMWGCAYIRVCAAGHLHTDYMACNVMRTDKGRANEMGIYEQRVADQDIASEYRAGRINATTAQIARVLVDFYGVSEVPATVGIRAAQQLEREGLSAYEVRKVRMGGLTYDYVTKVLKSVA